MAQYHTYHNGTYSGINLHVLTTNASNIQLVNLNEKSSLKGSSYYGINGGFFVMGENLLISLALNNGYQVGPGEQGTDNKWNGGGAIAWNGYAFEVYTPIQTKSQLSSKVAGGSSNCLPGTWAQGGYSMFLGASDWYSRIKSELSGADPSADQTKAGGSGMVADTLSKTVHLYVTKDVTSFTTFRRAVQAHIGISDGGNVNSRYKGLFLDGSYSSQMKAKKPDGSSTVVNVDWSAEGKVRSLTQIVALRNNS